jgi:adenylyltransferase/sulfurtransferase
MSELNDSQLLRYSRHILLPQFDLEGQRRLSEGRALVVGAGGLGSPVALYLASAGVGRITLADHDTVELSNLQRQIAHDSHSLGHNKAESAAARMRAINPEISVSVLAQRLQSDDLQGLLAGHDLVIDCSDNFATRHALNRAAVRCAVPLVSGAAVRFEGQFVVFDVRDAQSPCYHCLFPDAGEGNDGPCATFGVLAPLVGVIGSLQALEAIKLLAGIGVASGMLTLYDALSGRFRQVRVPRDPACPVCAQRLTPSPDSPRATDPPR